MNPQPSEPHYGQPHFSDPKCQTIPESFNQSVCMRKPQQQSTKCNYPTPSFFVPLTLSPSEWEQTLPLAGQTGTWVPDGPNPSISFTCRLPPGVYWVKIVGDMLGLARGDVLFDTGQGFLPEKSLPLNPYAPCTPMIFPAGVYGLRYVPSFRHGQFQCLGIEITRTLRISVLMTLAGRQIHLLGWASLITPSLWKKALQFSFRKSELRSTTDQDSYDRWVAENSLNEARRKELINAIAKLHHRPLISLILPIRNPGSRSLLNAIDSLKRQMYQKWEVYAMLDAVTSTETELLVRSISTSDSRIRVIAARDGAYDQLSMVAGEHVGWLNAQDELAEDALAWIARVLELHPTTDMVYSDEDKIDLNRHRSAPLFKPAWSPDTFDSIMYTGQLCVFRTSLAQQIGYSTPQAGDNPGREFALNFTSRTASIRHIPRVLYHRNFQPRGQTSIDTTEDDTLRMLKDICSFRGEGGQAATIPGLPGASVISYPTGEAMASIIIPMRDGLSLTKTCVESILTLTRHREFEILIVDNGSREPATHAWLTAIQATDPRIRVLSSDIPFNFSKLNNHAAAHARGEVLILLNNDIEIIDPEWLTALIGWARRPKIGAVGAKLLFADGTIQHAGIALGIYGYCGHPFKGKPAMEQHADLRSLVPCNWSAVTAACLAVGREHYLKVGGLDESFSVVFNDVDFCLRLRSIGLRSVCLNNIHLKHYESRTRGGNITPEKASLMKEEGDLFATRWGSLLNRDPYYNPNLTMKGENISVDETKSLWGECLLSRVE